MLNTFEFIETDSWCRLADSADDLYANHNTYLPLFSDALISFGDDVLIKNKSMEFIPEQNVKYFLETEAGGPITLNGLSKNASVGGAIVAHLSKVTIIDSSLLILVSENLSLLEGYGNRQWANYQLDTWPLAHNYPLCAIGVDANAMPIKKELSYIQ